VPEAPQGAVKVVDKESVERICEQIREDGEREVASILEKARSTAGDITGKAEAKRDEATESIMRDARERGETESRRLLSSVNIEVRRAKLRAREEVVGVITERVQEKLSSVRSSDEYPDILTRLVIEAIHGLGGKSFVIYVDKKDLDLLEKNIFPRVREALSAESSPISSLQARPLEKSSSGGARVGHPGGNVIYDNTFEARMFRYRDDIRMVIFDEVFYSEESGETGSA
jgi:vacuolar-type H+-ATPase subunit E/Vma4